MTTVLTIGTFDLLHPGHLRFLAACAEMALPNGKVVVGVNSDEFVAQYKTEVTIFDQDARADMLRALRHVDEVVFNPQPDDSVFPLLEQYGPGLLVIGSDWHRPSGATAYLNQLGLGATGDSLRNHGWQLVYVDRDPSDWSTKMVRREVRMHRSG